MTVHVHQSISEIATNNEEGGTHRHLRDKSKKRPVELDTERTWALNCTPECEANILATQEFAANHSGGVPFTLAEAQLKEDNTSKAMVETARLSQALAQLASERVASGVSG
jgi:hypothetical protein